MKKIMIKSITVVFFLFTITSCNDFLAEEPQNQIFLSQYFDDPNDAPAIVNPLYFMGANTLYTTGDFSYRWIMLDGYNSGLIDNEKKERPGVVEGQQLTISAANMDIYFDNWWTGCYKAISQANNAIKYIPQVPEITESEANRYLAEARFFRAFNYFSLVQNWGDVPLITEPYESLEGIFTERSPMSEVYDLMIEDLEWAVDNGGLADVPFPMNGFRITKGAAATLLANIYLYSAGFPLQETSNYAMAAQYARMVINSGQYSLIQNGPTPEESAYNVIRTSDVEDEYIYSIEVDGVNRGNFIVSYTLPIFVFTLLPDVKIKDMMNAYRPTDEFIRLYDPDLDLRIQERQLFHSEITRGGSTHDFAGNLAVYQWFNEDAVFGSGINTKDQIVYRYPEVLLIAAEAIANTEGVTAEAVSYLTEVRSRAYWQTDENDIRAELEGLSVQQFIEEVWKEHLRENVLEFKTWSLMKRTRQFPVTTVGNPGDVSFVDLIGHTNQFGATFQEHNLLYPIPETVLQRNPALTQNDGYIVTN